MPIIIALSGASSSGKTEVLSRLQAELAAQAVNVVVRPSLSRQQMSASTTLDDRKSPQFQLNLLQAAIDADAAVIASGADVILADRTVLDGYLYFKKYGTGSATEYDTYLTKVRQILSTYACVVLLPSVCFREDEIRREFDREFSAEFFNSFISVFPHDVGTELIVMPKIFGIDGLYREVRQRLANYLPLKENQDAYTHDSK